MRSFRALRRHATYANVASTLALFIALGGTAYAAGITGSSVVNGSLTGADIRNESLHGVDVSGLTGADISGLGSADVTNGSLQLLDLAAATQTALKGDPGAPGTNGQQGANGPAGDMGDQGLQGDPGISGAQGDAGPQGIQGEPGLEGIQGEQGPQGVQGEQGPPGSASAMFGGAVGYGGAAGWGANLCTLGEVRLFAGNFGDDGIMLPADGRLLPINMNQALFEVIGTLYGGDGQTTFALPNLVGAEPKGNGPAAPNYYVCTTGIYPN